MQYVAYRFSKLCYIMLHSHLSCEVGVIGSKGALGLRDDSDEIGMPVLGNTYTSFIQGQ